MSTCPDFNPDPDIEAEAERYAAACEARDQAYADMIADCLDLPRYDDPYGYEPGPYTGDDNDDMGFLADGPDLEF